MASITMGPLLVIVGETASGKSALALEIAERYNGEIIGADSWTVYRDFDIGTAKPSTEERTRIRHHLFDIVDAPNGFNAAQFKALANQAIQDIHRRRKLPILVGGTGLYIDSVIFDYSFLPTGTPGERERLNNLTVEDLLLEASDKSVSLEGVDIRNKRRIIRAIETGGVKPMKQDLRPHTAILGLQIDSDTLKRRITKRVDAMISAGLEREVAELVSRYGWDVEPMKGIGYFEWRDYFCGIQNHEQTRERIISSTLKLAKRQRTWFKRNNSIHWVRNREETVGILTTLLNKND